MSENLNHSQQDPNEDLSLGLKILSFCIPLAGAIIYFMKKDQQPKQAKTACYAALIGMAVGVVLQIIMTVAGGLANY